ncbi:hypothetical protein [Jongsikchunia kroppenstedtii]|uniref:hypothetical protein n=1 Tax=Jongsikchunia kroppenstedtii TaxID=1121721 RepID=UPI0003A1381F|nr:hypothetical protein [Jongsikchunia kroppenstedtii]
MTSPGMTVDVDHVRGIVDHWTASGKRLSGLHFPEFAGVSAPGSAVAAALRSLRDPTERACADIGERLAGLADAADDFLRKTTGIDTSAAESFPGHR